MGGDTSRLGDTAGEVGAPGGDTEQSFSLSRKSTGLNRIMGSGIDCILLKEMVFFLVKASTGISGLTVLANRFKLISNVGESTRVGESTKHPDSTELSWFGITELHVGGVSILERDNFLLGVSPLVVSSLKFIARFDIGEFILLFCLKNKF